MQVNGLGRRRRENMFPRRVPGKTSLDYVRLFLGHIADDGQLELLALISLQYEHKPENETTQSDQRPNQQCEPSEDRDVAYHGEHYPKHKPRHVEENILKGMEADKSIPVVGFDNQKDNRRNDGDVGKQTGDVVAHTPSRGRYDSRTGGCGFAAGWTGYGSLGHLSTARTAECHGTSPLDASQRFVARTGKCADIITSRRGNGNQKVFSVGRARDQVSRFESASR